MIKIKYHNKNLVKVEQSDKGDWIDLRASETIELKAFESCIIPLGISVKLEDGYEAWLAPRSSTFKNWGVIQTNGIGVIDNSYSGDNDIWGMPVLALRDTVVHENDRICQFRIMPKMRNQVLKEVEMLGDVDRGGFGSTGVA